MSYGYGYGIRLCLYVLLPQQSLLSLLRRLKGKVISLVRNLLRFKELACADTSLLIADNNEI